jgi:hypothetical protein
MRSLRVAASIAFIFGSLCLSELTYGSRGVQTLSYNGTLLEDVGANGSDAFHIWHMKMTDLSGNAASCAECGWGESNMGRNWNGATNTMTYSFSWGLISVQFAQAGNSLNMNVSVTNQANSGYIFDGATIYPFVLNFAQLPAGFIDPSYSQLGYETIGPGVVNADFGVGEVSGHECFETAVQRLSACRSRLCLYTDYQRHHAGRARRFSAALRSAGAAGTDGQFHRVVAVRAFGNADWKPCAGCLSKLGADLAGAVELVRPPGYRDGVPGELSAGQCESAGRLSEQSAAILQRQQRAGLRRDHGRWSGRVSEEDIAAGGVAGDEPAKPERARGGDVGHRRRAVPAVDQLCLLAG